MEVLTVSKLRCSVIFIFIIVSVHCEVLRWCVRDAKEEAKCEWLKTEVLKKKYPATQINETSCVRARDNYECLKMIGDYKADVVNIDAGFAYYASPNFVSVIFNAERYANNEDKYYSVAVVPIGSSIKSPLQLKNTRLCSTGVREVAGWTLPLSNLAGLGILPVTTCDVDVKTAAQFFKAMCAPDALNTYNNPFGDNPVSSCALCGSVGQDWCTYGDKYGGSEGPLLCLKDDRADVAFMRSIDVEYLTMSQNGVPAKYDRSKYELLCSKGGRQSLGSYASCNWGEAPANVLVTSGARTNEQLVMYRYFMQRLSRDFPPIGYTAVPPSGGGSAGSASNVTTPAPTTTTRAPSVNEPFTLFNTNSSFGLNSLVSSAAVELKREDSEAYQYIGGEDYQAKLDLLQSCSVGTVRFCVVSEYEMRKCENLLLALRSKMIRPELDCIMGKSTKDCMVKIEEGDADIITLDAGDIYEAGKYNDLVPIANENYGDTGNYYYSVAVAWKIESRLTLFNLIARNSCHGSMRSASGWIYPVLSLIETGQITPQKCEAIKKVGELFRRSCVPGILDAEYNKEGTNPINLCENCAAGGMDKCQRNTRELYYGDSGAFRCLVEFGGDIAFVRHMTPRDNTDGRNPDFWARNRRSDDYELLCKNGKRAPITNWKNCYLAKVPARAVVTASYKTTQEREIFWNLLNYAQQFFSADDNPYFTLFDSGVDQGDLLFSDSTVKLVQIDSAKQTYQDYLGVSFLKAVNTLNQFDCTSSANSLHVSLLTALLSTFLVYNLL